MKTSMVYLLIENEVTDTSWSRRWHGLFLNKGISNVIVYRTKERAQEDADKANKIQASNRVKQFHYRVRSCLVME